MFLFELFFPAMLFFGLEALFVFFSVGLAGLGPERNSVLNALKFSALNFAVALVTGWIFNIFLASALIYLFSRIYFLKSIYRLSLDELITVGIYSTVIMVVIAFFILLRS